MLPETARQVIGLPHLSGRVAMRMLEAEGLACEGYVDIFDGGPTMVAQTDRVRSVAGARKSAASLGQPGAGRLKALVAAGRLAAFRSCCVDVEVRGDTLVLESEAARMLAVRGGEAVWWIER
jgi:arginine N-succinyltransferase